MQDLTGCITKLGSYPFANGGFADVWKGDWKNSCDETPRLVAIKVLRTYMSDAESRELLCRRLKREIQVWDGLSHPNITCLNGMCSDFGPPFTPSLVCPYYDNGNILSYMQTNSNADRMKLVSEAAAGLSYLHGLTPPVIHGDIKGTNILVNDKGEVSITDFGLSRVLGSSGFTTKSLGGTVRWMARELIEPAEEEAVPKTTTQSDVWAFAMTVLEILTSRMPFFHLRLDPAVILYVLQGGLPLQTNYPETAGEVWSVLERCWHRKPERRPSIRTISLFFDIVYAHKQPLSNNQVKLVLNPFSRHPCRNIRDATWRTERCRRQSTQCLPSPQYRQSQLPYPCNWASCGCSFTALGDCQSHEVQLIHEAQHIRESHSRPLGRHSSYLVNYGYRSDGGLSSHPSKKNGTIHIFDRL